MKDPLYLRFLSCAKQVSIIAKNVFTYITVTDYTEIYRASPIDADVKKIYAVVIAHDDEKLENLYEEFHNNNHFTDDLYDDKCEYCREKKFRYHFKNFVLTEINQFYIE